MVKKSRKKTDDEGYKYDEDIVEYKWSTFKKGNIGIGSLIYLAKKDNPQELINYVGEPKKIKKLYDSIKFNRSYLLDKDENIKDDKSLVSNNINKLFNGVIKTLCIKSTYNTGKTQIIKKILKEFEFKRVLIVSYRQTLTIAYCLLLIAYCLLLIAYCLLLIAYCLLLIAYCLLLIAYCLLLIAYCLLLIAYCLLLIAYCLLLIAYCLLLIAYCLLDVLTAGAKNTSIDKLLFIAYCLLLIAYCLLLIAYCLLLIRYAKSG